MRLADGGHGSPGLRLADGGTEPFITARPQVLRHAQRLHSSVVTLAQDLDLAPHWIQRSRRRRQEPLAGAQMWQPAVVQAAASPLWGLHLWA
jgi:hypothetical protein